ncbi:exodeoxyribonuclease V subunit gamma [Christiangramia sabulilitoris]|uniref:Exonuclease V subunit gamma n=1 Tax=Christiangramia sabulilitoris TaxID=2583991 RepID=A0A550I7L1_9FLAO|nr:exodeoxyribonuclease V subunit gamma [Christiangramia sabulilitoris]TRO66960.1 exonuclease V subunit gamma [Christiangramia sabulilitoris]
MQEIIDMSPNKFNFIAANSNLQLARELGDHIKKNFKDEDLVFEPVHIITPNKAQHNWLKEQLAVHLGFIANLEQHSLNSFFKQCTGQLFPENKEFPERGRLVWELFSALNNKEFKTEFKKIATYCGDDEVKRLALAQKVARLLGEYEQYKPELLESWKNNQEDKSNEDEAWQACLYRLSGFDQALITATDFKERLNKEPEALSTYKEIFLFGDLQFTPLQLQYLKVMQNFSEFRIQIFRTNLKLNEKNSLLQQWGKLARKTADDLQKLNLKIDAEVELPSAETDLQKIKQELLSEKNAGELGGDDSLLIYNSFTKLREVEAMYNYLVKTVDEANGKLGARDIAVYVPQLDPYIPAIKTVFDTAPHTFPYTLVSKGFSREEGFWSALEQVLDFEEENFTASAVFNLLESEPIQKSFGFSSELDLLRKAFLEANIRREYKGNPEYETHYVSFSYGLERLMYGFCLGDETPVEIEGRKIYPVDLFDGAQAQDLFRLYQLVEKLQELLDKKIEARSAADWHKLLMQIAEDFLSPEDWQEQRFSNFMQNLISLETSDETIAFRTFYHRFKDHLQQQDVQQIRGGGGIVFSGLYPGVSMPKKVVAFLGLNFKEFPRKSQQVSFDLLSEEDRIGTGDTDRGAFLQAFLNAEVKVLLSYIGQNIKDNSAIPASSIISEIQDYAEKKGKKIKEIKHALHAYNSKYFKEKEKDYFTYLIGKDSKLDLHKKEIDALQKPEEISLFSLESFLKDPFKHYYQKVLGVYYQDDVNLPEWEMFEPDNLEKWQIKYAVLSQNLETASGLEEQRELFLNQGIIPLKTPGEVLVEDAQQKVDLLTEKLREISSEEISEIEFEVPFYFEETGNHTLKCKLPMLGGQGLFLSVSKLKSKYKLAAYLRYLSLVAGGQADTLNYVCLADGEVQALKISYSGLVTQEQAKQTLRDWLSLYLKNFERIQPFSPEFGFSLKDVEADNKDLRKNIDKKFDSSYCYPSEYLRTEHRDGYFEKEDNLDDFKSNFKLIMEPVELANSK